MFEANHLFPQGHALGEAFCNRTAEREQLVHSYLSREHTLVVAPRRYGKSSLIKQSILDAGIPGKRMDLLPATNILFINKAIKSCVSELASQILPRAKNAKEKILQFMQAHHPKLTLNVFGQRLEISTAQSAEQSVIEMLVGLDTMARKVKKKLVICFDEFQQVGLLKNNHSIEASIRHAVEKSSQITYVFSGSSRHLLSQMFNSKSRPLYHLCELMEIKRISTEAYLPILQARAKKQWRKQINPDVVSEILCCTKCHPYYVNALCRQLWKLKVAPSRAKVQSTWLEYIKTQQNWIGDDLSRMTPNQKNILAALAYMPVAEPYASEFCHRVKLGASSVKSVLDSLKKVDFVYVGLDGKYRVLDPAVEEYLLQIPSFDFIDELT